MAKTQRILAAGGAAIALGLLVGANVPTSMKTGPLLVGGERASTTFVSSDEMALYESRPEDLSPMIPAHRVSEPLRAVPGLGEEQAVAFVSPVGGLSQGHEARSYVAPNPIDGADVAARAAEDAASEVTVHIGSSSPEPVLIAAPAPAAAPAQPTA